MHTDIVFPKDNEDEFIQIAEKLGYDSLCFVYEFINEETSIRIKNKIKNKKTKLKLLPGLLLDFKNLKKIKKIAGIIIAESSYDNRKVLEKRYADVVYNLESYSNKDFIHHRASGLNHILANIAHENDVVIGFSFDSVINSRNPAMIIGRISQNIKLCRKYKVKTIIASFASDPYEMRTPHDLIALFSVAGMHPKEAKESLGNVFGIVKEK